jgi:hypothetical protein
VSKIDGWDVLALLGVLLIAAGLWCVAPVAVLFWLGIVAMVTGIVGAR